MQRIPGGSARWPRVDERRLSPRAKGWLRVVFILESASIGSGPSDLMAADPYNLTERLANGVSLFTVNDESRPIGLSAPGAISHLPGGSMRHSRPRMAPRALQARHSFRARLELQKIR